MTGEISLRGSVLPVGGIKEKLLAAHRAGLKRVLIPHRNERDLDDVPADVRDELKSSSSARMDEFSRSCWSRRAARAIRAGRAGRAGRRPETLAVRERPRPLTSTLPAVTQGPNEVAAPLARPEHQPCSRSWCLLGIGFCRSSAARATRARSRRGSSSPERAAIATALDTVRRQGRAVRRVFARGGVGDALALVGITPPSSTASAWGSAILSGGPSPSRSGPAFGAVMGGAGARSRGSSSSSSGRSVRTVLPSSLRSLGPRVGILLSCVASTAARRSSRSIPSSDSSRGRSTTRWSRPRIPLLTYRLGSVLTLACCGHSRCAPGARTKRVGRCCARCAVRESPLLGAVCATASLMLVLEGWRLGHWQTAVDDRARLGARGWPARAATSFTRGRCATRRRVSSRATATKSCPHREATSSAADAGRVTAYLFPSSADKRRLMGAGDTFIAKPWRREVYLQASGYPHPVLGARARPCRRRIVRAGVRSTSPATWKGSAPNPGLIEGVAVAASPDEDALTPAEWSRAMLDLKLLPSLTPRLLVRFPRRERLKSYTVAGAFVRFVKDKYGARSSSRWYGGAKLPELTKLVGRARAAGTPISSRSRFPRRPVPSPRHASIGPRCGDASAPTRSTFYRKEARARAGSRRLHRGRADVRRSASPRSARRPGASVDWPVVSLRRGENKEATKILAALPPTRARRASCKNRALSQLADSISTQRRLRSRCTALRAARRTILDEDSLRTIEVKTGSLGDPRARRAIAAYLVETPSAASTR